MEIRVFIKRWFNISLTAVISESVECHLTHTKRLLDIFSLPLKDDKILNAGVWVFLYLWNEHEEILPSALPQSFLVSAHKLLDVNPNTQVTNQKLMNISWAHEVSSWLLALQLLKGGCFHSHETNLYRLTSFSFHIFFIKALLMFHTQFVRFTSGGSSMKPPFNTKVVHLDIHTYQNSWLIPDGDDLSPVCLWIRHPSHDDCNSKKT